MAVNVREKHQHGIFEMTIQEQERRDKVPAALCDMYGSDVCSQVARIERDRANELAQARDAKRQAATVVEQRDFAKWKQERAEKAAQNAAVNIIIYINVYSNKASKQTRWILQMSTELEMQLGPVRLEKYSFIVRI